MKTSDLELEFEAIWKKYPNKQGKKRAFESYVKAREKGTTYEMVYNGLENYLNYCQREKSWYKPKMGSTWFNGYCWLDEIQESSEEIVKDAFGNYIL